LIAIDRLEDEGVPPIPTFIEDDNEPHSLATPKAGNRLLAAPSPAMIEAVEDAEIEEAAVRQEEAAVRKKENTVRKLRLEFEEQQARDRLAMRAQEERARVAREQAAAREREDVVRHRTWVEEWTERALRRIPREAPGPLRLALHKAVMIRLADLPRSQSNTLTQRLIDAEIDRVLAPWTYQRKVDAAVEMVCSQLPYDLRCSPQSAMWKNRVMQAARNEIEHLGNVPRWQLVAAGTAAAKPIIAEFDHVHLCANLVRTLPAGLTSEEQAEARERIQEALSRFPVLTSARRLEQARDAELVPFHQILKKREHDRLCESVLQWASHKLPYRMSSSDSKNALETMRTAVTMLPIGTPACEMEAARDRVADRIKQEHERQRRIETLIEGGLREIYPYVQRLVDCGRVELERGETVYSVVEGFKEVIRQGLKEDLKGAESAEDVKRLAQESVREELDL
jgi:hypothetical protein